MLTQQTIVKFINEVNDMRHLQKTFSYNNSFIRLPQLHQNRIKAIVAKSEQCVDDFLTLFKISDDVANGDEDNNSTIINKHYKQLSTNH